MKPHDLLKAITPGLKALAAVVSLISLSSLNPITSYGNDRFKPSSIKVYALKSGLGIKPHGKQNWAGIEAELLNHLELSSGANIEISIFNSPKELEKAYAQGHADLVLGRLNQDRWLKTINATRGPSFEDSNLTMFCRRSSRVKTIADLENRLILIHPDHKSLVLGEITNSNVALFWSEKEISPDQMLRQVAYQKADCAITERYEGLYHMRRFLGVGEVMPASQAYQIGWLVNSQNKNLNKYLKNWAIDQMRSGQTLATLERHKSHLDDLGPLDFLHFWKNVQHRLPRLEPLFKKAAKEHKLPWQLIAAVAYQESQWQHSARSFTGVRGIMQLTQNTARYLGVKNPADVEENIFGGAKYLRYLMDKTPKHLSEKERLALTLAAYNFGPGHVQSAQKLAVKRKKNPHRWVDLKEILPVLSAELYEDEAARKKVRGHEPIQFVSRVRNFYDLLTR